MVEDLKGYLDPEEELEDFSTWETYEGDGSVEGNLCINLENGEVAEYRPEDSTLEASEPPL